MLGQRVGSTMNAELGKSNRASFLCAIPSEQGACWVALAALEFELSRVWDQARGAWPTIALRSEEFFTYLGQRAPEEATVATLGAVHTQDLYLACACAARMPSALIAFEAYCADEWRRARSKVSVSDAVAAETQQALRTRLFVSEEPGDEHIRRYSGSGALHAWYRTTAVRTLIDAARSASREPRSANDGDLDEHVAMVDMELDYLKRNYRAEFKESFHTALRTLSTEERNLLRYQLLEQLTLEQIGRIYGVHLTSIGRRLQKLRQQLLRETREGLRGRLGIDEGELDSIMRLIGSRLDVSLSTVLGETARS